ncbi:hypothetical protein I4U23_019202 [Adineta vaga]|nr:hypothetical protein I4U23_019202 [Adineta vaga]
MSKSFERNMPSKLSLKSTQSVPIILNEKSTSSVTTNHLNVQENQQQLDMMHRIVDQTDQDLRYALEHAANRREQLDILHLRSEEMLSKNENLVFGISNYRKIQERDLFWQRFRYSIFGFITIGVIILIIILSMTKKQSTSSSSHIIDIRHSNEQTTSVTTVLISSPTQKRKKRKIINNTLTFKLKYIFHI